MANPIQNDVEKESGDSRSDGISARRYFLLSITVSFFLLLAVCTLGVWGIFCDRSFGFQILYHHQLDKIAAGTGIETVFVGDSSLGNALDAGQFSKLTGTRTVNLALTGLYAYAGAYNMVKKLEDQPVRNVVVVSTISTMTRDVSYGGYVLTLTRPADALELSSADQSALLDAFYNLVFSPGNLRSSLKSILGLQRRKHVIEADYIQQGPAQKVRHYEGIDTARLIPQKTLFLARLVEYCRARNINIIHAHGPVIRGWGEASMDFVGEVNRRLSRTGVLNITNLTLIAPEHLGDSEDHVAPGFKSEYTRRYAELIGPLLSVSSKPPTEARQPRSGVIK